MPPFAVFFADEAAVAMAYVAIPIRKASNKATHADNHLTLRCC